MVLEYIFVPIRARILHFVGVGIVAAVVGGIFVLRLGSRKVARIIDWLSIAMGRDVPRY